MKFWRAISTFLLDKWDTICYKKSRNLAVIFGILIVPLLLHSPVQFSQNTAPMLTITVSSGGASGAIRYFKEGLSKEGNYYLDQNIKAYWAGKTSKMLGIEGKQVTKETFARLVNRLHPEIEGKKLGVRYSNTARAGVDLTFSPHKSISLLHSLTKKPEILEMHRRSYMAAMLKVEELMHTQNNTKYKRGYTHTGNIVYAAFDHFLSRPVDIEFNGEKTQIADCQLHTHCFMPSITWNEEKNRYQAIEIFTIHKNSDYIRTVYHNALAHELEAAGFQIERDGNFVKLAGVTRNQIERFSARGLEIDRIAEEKGLSAKEKGELGAKTRNNKTELSLSDQELYEHWLTRLSEQELKELKELQGKKFDRPEPISAKEAVDRALEFAFERNSVENEKKVIAYGSKLGYGHLTIDEVTKEVQARENILKSERDTIEYITTRELVQEEDRMIELATSGKGKGQAYDINILPIPDFFNDQQRKACLEQIHSFDMVTILKGAPGTGKSTVFSYLDRFWKKAGKSLTAVAPSTQASQALAEKGLESNTIAGLLSSNKKAQGKLQNGVLLIDEAAMIGTKNMSALLELGSKYQCRILLSGDTNQMGPPAQYGDALAILEKQSRLQVSTIDDIMRQRNAPAYKSAVKDIWKGDILRGYQKLNKQGAVIEISDHHERIEKLAKDCVKAHAQKHSVLIVTPTHYEGDLINQAVREEMKKKKFIHGKEKIFDTLKDISYTTAEKKDFLSYQKGHVIRFTKNQQGGYKAGSHHEIIGLEKDQQVKVRDLKTGRVSHLPYQNPEHFSVHTKHSIELAKGDKIRLTNNATSLQGTKMANGTCFEIKKINKRGIELSNGKTIPNDLYHYRYSYADTAFSSQGKDAHTVLLSMSDLSQGGINEKSFTVGVSRGAQEVKIYTSDKDSLKKSIIRSTERLSAKDIAKDHQDRRIQRRKQAFQKNLNDKMKSHERVHGREKTSSRGISKDHSRG